VPQNWLFCSELPQVGEQCRLGEEEQRHCKVLRLQAGDGALLVDGQGTKAWARLTDIKACLWLIESREFIAPPPSRVLRMPYLQGGKMDWVIEKATEWGVTSIELFVADKSCGHRARLERFQSLIKAAAKQSGQVWWPRIYDIDKLSSWKPTDVPIYYGSLSSRAQGVSEIHVEDSFCWTCGPEGGWSDAEEQCLQQLGATPLKLCGSTLRAETALIGGLSALVATLTTAKQ